MAKVVTAVFDGTVLRTDTPLDLEPNARYVISIEAAARSEPSGDVWDLLDRLAGSIEAPADWSAEHDHHLYGTPKRA